MSTLVRKQFVASEITKDGGDASRVRRFVISTGGVDRDNDTVDAKGWQLDNYRANPVVLWAHDYKQLPLGKALSVGVEGGNLVATAEFADHEMANTVLRMIDGGFLRATSVGFKPKKAVDNVERGGVDFKEQELLEFSIVPVPANPQALVTMGADDPDVALITKWASEWMVAKAAAEVEAPTVTEAPEFLDAEPDPVRWNRALSKAFDVDEEPLDASSLEYTWVSRFLSTPVKHLYETTVHVGGAKVGPFLCALDDGLAPFKTASVRNIDRTNREVPPVYETMQLNSTLQRSFLVHGIRFMNPGEFKMAVKVQPSWAGVALTFYASDEAAAKVVGFVDQTYAKAATYKFLKGEAFSVSGEFLQRDGTAWADLFLAPVNLEPLQRTVQLLNEQGADMDPRGVILMGPPGTGKTLAGRVMMNEAKDVTYIWVSNRDLNRLGSFGGLTMAFDLAQENAPSVILMEDIDADLSYHTDLLKTELDGLKRKRGVVTVLTTNHPDQLPKALIDRPGRFHDVLRIDLPTETIRRAMLAKWAPDADAATLDEMAKQTQGMAGAHIRELVRFADVIRSQDGVDLNAALGKALTKLKEQREVIDAARSERTLRSVKAIAQWPMPAPAKHAHGGGRGICSKCGTADVELAAAVCGECVADLNPWTHDALVARVAQLVKSGRVLSRANEGRVRSAKEMLDEVLRQLEAPAGTEEAAAGDEQCAHGEDPATCAACAAEKAEQCEHGQPGGQCPECAGKAAEGEAVLDLTDETIELSFDEFVLDMAEEDEVLDVDPSALRTLMAEALAAAVGGAVRDITETTVARLRGRVD